MDSNKTSRIQLATPSTEQAVSRRKILKRGGMLAGAGALLAASPSVAFARKSNSDIASDTEPAGAGGTTLEFEVACDGNTFVINRAPGSEPDGPVRRGDPFLVSGRIFPAGTIDAGLEGPHQEGSIGTWVCRGWFYFGLEDLGQGAVPHVVTSQLYLFDNFDGLASEGMEGGIQTQRIITGGYGQYSGARGHIVQDEVATNSTTLNLGGGALVPAPNIKFKFNFAE